MRAGSDDEWSLIQSSEAHSSGSQLVQATIRGDFATALRDTAAKSLLEPFARSIGTHVAGSPYSLATIRCSIDTSDNDDRRALDALAIAVASLHAFVQANWTGPDLEDDIANGVKLLRSAVPDAFPARQVLDSENEQDCDAQLNANLQIASLDALTYSGEPAYHLCQSPFLLVFALRLLDSLPIQKLATLPLWRLRAFSIHSRLLDMPQPPPPALLSALQPLKSGLQRAIDGDTNPHNSLRWGRILAQLLTDEALSIQRAGRERDANDLLLEAGKASRLAFRVTGAPGKRTKFQREDRMILVLLARSAGEQDGEDAASAEDSTNGDEDEAYDETPSTLPPTSQNGWNVGPATDQAADMPSNMLHNDDTLLERTRFTSSHTADYRDGQSDSELTDADVLRPTVLHPLDSCILLGLCLNIHNASPENGLTNSQMNAFVNRVLAHARNWSVYTMALLLRSRLEADRTRTAQRSALQLQALLDQMPTADSSVAERLRLVHELELPSKWEMQAELARRYASLGVLRSALEIFQRIELWQEVVQCWGALGRQDKGIEVVRDLLQGSKAESDHVISAKRDRADHVGQQLSAARQAKLWCLLGDLEVSKAAEHYAKAWEVSAKRSARAARSLGGVSFAEGDYVQASLWLRRALKIQPLYARSWFMLGCVYMRFDTTNAYVEAARCFRRCTALEDDDAESWNNLASCYLRLAQHSEGVLREARLADEAEGQTDQRAVLQTLEQDGDVGDDQSDADSLHSRDSGVAVLTDSEAESGTETETEDDAPHRRQQQASTLPSLSGALSSAGGGGAQGAYDVKLLAHRALEKALRLAHDDWRVWNNFMIVSVDCGMMNDAVRSLVRVVELRSKASVGFSSSSETSKTDTMSGEAVDVAVLNRIVDAVIRAPSNVDAVVPDGQKDAVVDQAAHLRHNPHEGHGLWPAVRQLFEQTLLTRISSSPDIWRSYARLLFWRGMFRSALNAHLSAWQASYGAEASAIATEREEWLRGVEALQELCELMENFGERDVFLVDEKELDVDEIKTANGKDGLVKEVAMSNWRFRARSLVRTFIGRTRDAFDGDQQWDKLVELRDSFSTNAAH